MIEKLLKEDVCNIPEYVIPSVFCSCTSVQEQINTLYGYCLQLDKVCKDLQKQIDNIGGR